MDDLSGIIDASLLRDKLDLPSEDELSIFDRSLSYDPPLSFEISSNDEEVIGSVSEDLTNFSAFEVEEKKVDMRVERNLHFPFVRGFHSTYDSTERYNIRFTLEKINYRVETLEHIHSGKKVRADLRAIGPDRSKATWDSIALLICLAIQMALPIDRLRKMFSSVAAYSGASICRYLELAANKLSPIYLLLTQQIADDVEVVSGDDTKTRVLQMEQEMKAGLIKGQHTDDSLIARLEKKLGRAFSRKDGHGHKSQLNVSHLHGLTDPSNPRSIIFLFRTHFGSVGDLLSRILSHASPKAKRKIFQGDLSSTNFPNKSIIARWIAGVAGCASHARRPFFRYRQDDDGLCDRMLELFALSAAIEKQIDKDGRSPARTLDYRQRLAMPVWDQIIALAYSVIDAEARARANNKLHFLWPKKSHLYQGCKYIVKHRKAITAYLTDHRLAAGNNRAERLLRSEKILLVSCKFRRSENGRVVFDILRTLVMTASGACGDAKSYLCWVLKQPDEEIKAQPHLYTPLAFHQMQSSSAPDLQATGS